MAGRRDQHQAFAEQRHRLDGRIVGRLGDESRVDAARRERGDERVVGAGAQLDPHVRIALVIGREYRWQAARGRTLQSAESQHAARRGATDRGFRFAGQPNGMSDEEVLVHVFTTELLAHCGVCDATYRAAVERLGEAGVVELTSLVGYFAAVSMVLNVAHIPEEPNSQIVPLAPLSR